MSAERMLPEEAQKVLGEDVYALIRSGDLQPESWGGRIYVREDEVFALLAEHQARQLGRGRNPMPVPARRAQSALSPSMPRQAPAPARTASRPAQTSAKSQTASPVSSARPRTIPEMRAAGVLFAGDEAVRGASRAPAAAAADTTRAEIDRLVGFSTLRPPPTA